ncbi:DUF2946 domain-containing protein [Zestomonas carbonaria]|uniref:DUF2946 domain-containing protein n=1 Tax=Zestomonas carbonaria TaxID=2762745 RepID=A0A7U7IC48_9GAMM|nr:DUF2946 domain-containing protein [Pseudomonas carbonaria]CAD5109797.1 hypothetical protein PSEWESI4_04111 [Pseudomonas carbonaria]
MSPTLSRRQPLTAWVLYFSVLFGVLACGLGHGQMLGLQLNGIGGAFCSIDNKAQPSIDLAAGGQSDSQPSVPFNCPLCGSIVLGVALLFCLFWLRLASSTPRLRREQRSKAPPRYSWPSANPRASPL